MFFLGKLDAYSFFFFSDFDLMTESVSEFFSTVVLFHQKFGLLIELSPFFGRGWKSEKIDIHYINLLFLFILLLTLIGWV